MKRYKVDIISFRPYVIVTNVSISASSFTFSKILYGSTLPFSLIFFDEFFVIIFRQRSFPLTLEVEKINLAGFLKI